MEEILRYDIGAEISKGDAEPGGAGAQANMFGDQGLTYRSRGLVGGTSINGFQTAVESNTYNVERVGATRGPNAILFGTGAPGGILNFRTRAPSLSRNTANLELKVAGESTKRAAVDINRVLWKDKLGLRIMGVHDRKGSAQPHQYQDFNGITLAANYRFRRDTELSVSYAREHNEGVSGRDWNHVDGLTRFASALDAGLIRWNQGLERYENASGTALVAATSGTGNVSNRTVLVYGPDLSVPARLWEGASSAVNRITLSTNASRFNFNSDQPIIDERYERYGSVTPSGSGEFAGVSTDNLTAILNHRWFSRLFMELAYNLNHRRSDTTLGQSPTIAADLNYRLPDGSLNPYFLGTGHYYAQQNFLRLKRTIDNETLRASFSYDHDFGARGGQHRLAVMAERNRNHNSRLRQREVWAGRPYNAAAENAATSGSAARRRTTPRASSPATPPIWRRTAQASRTSAGSPPTGWRSTPSTSMTASRPTPSWPSCRIISSTAASSPPPACATIPSARSAPAPCAIRTAEDSASPPRRTRRPSPRSGGTGTPGTRRPGSGKPPGPCCTSRAASRSSPTTPPASASRSATAPRSPRIARRRPPGARASTTASPSASSTTASAARSSTTTPRAAGSASRAAPRCS
jgi:hypothetical protein